MLVRHPDGDAKLVAVCANLELERVSTQDTYLGTVIIAEVFKARG